MKKLKVAMIGGGGPGSFFGKVHWKAIALDGTRELTAGVLRSRPDEALAAAEEWGLRGFPDVGAMVRAWQRGQVELDYVVIATPNVAHYAAAKACVEAGLPVLCEKPLTYSVEQAEKLAALVKRTRVPFLVSYTYTGHPMMMLAREWVRGGKLGRVRKVEAWYAQGWLSQPLERTGQRQAVGRTDPKRSGISNCGGDIGTHAFEAATWVTGLQVTRVSARLNRFVKGRVLDDDFNAIGELSNGGTAIITATQIAVGHKNDHGLRIFGEQGSLEWRQERAERLVLNLGERDEVYWIGGGGFIPPSIGSYLRLPGGHHEDFIEALANLHSTLERMIRRRRGEKVPAPYPHPGVEDGLAGMRFVAAAVKSSKARGAWTAV